MIGRTLIASLPLLVTGSLFVPLAAASAPVATTATPKALSLTTRDVQAVYGGSFRPFIANAYKASGRTTCGADYTGGYAATFGNFQKASKSGGVVSVQSTVFAYGNARSATCASTMYGSSFAKASTRAGATVHTSPLGGVGDSAFLSTATSTLGSAHQRAYSVMIWLFRGRYLATVTISAVGSAPARSGAINLARIIDGRIQSAG